MKKYFRRTLLRRLSSLSSVSGSTQPQDPTGSLASWKPGLDNPWDTNAVLHFYHRLGFGVSSASMASALATTPQELIRIAMEDTLVSDAGMPIYPEQWNQWMHGAPYSGTDHAGYQAQELLYQTGKVEIRLAWIVQMMNMQTHLREKLVYVWANHFVVELQKNYYPKHVYTYWDCLRHHAWGNLKEMIKEIAIQPAMLLYLNGESSTKDSINENFAREVMELFLMGRVDRYGKPNYTQEDVRAVAYAVCGWRFWPDAPPPDTIHAYFAEYYFDLTRKTTPFGAPSKVYGLMAAKEKGLFTYLDVAIEEDIFDVMFAYRAEQISWHIAETVYQAFVSPISSSVAAQAVIEEMASLLRTNNWELKPMLSALFISEHFFDLTFRGAVIKSPYEYMLSMCHSLDIPFGRQQAGTAEFEASELYVSLMNPPNVKGWPGDHEWLNSSTLPKRNRNLVQKLVLEGQTAGVFIDEFTGYTFDQMRWSDDQVRAWAKQFSGFSTSAADFAIAISNATLAIPLTDDMVDPLLTSIGLLHPSEWIKLDDASRIALTRKLVNAIFLLPQYQLQ